MPVYTTINSILGETSQLLLFTTNILLSIETHLQQPFLPLTRAKGSRKACSNPPSFGPFTHSVESLNGGCSIFNQPSWASTSLFIWYYYMALFWLPEPPLPPPTHAPREGKCKKLELLNWAKVQFSQFFTARNYII